MWGAIVRHKSQRLWLLRFGLPIRGPILLAAMHLICRVDVHYHFQLDRLVLSFCLRRHFSSF